MRLLLDSHALLWWLLDDPRLPAQPRKVLRSGANDVFVSSASAWEICTKHRLGKLPEAERITSAFEAVLATEGFRALPISVRHGQLSGNLPGLHRDPFDRMLIAQALIEDLTLVSNETRFDGFGVSRLW